MQPLPIVRSTVPTPSLPLKIRVLVVDDSPVLQKVRTHYVCTYALVEYKLQSKNSKNKISLFYHFIISHLTLFFVFTNFFILDDGEMVEKELLRRDHCE